MSRKTLKTVLLWASRLVGFAALCFFLTFFIGEGITEMTSKGFVLDVAFVFLVIYLALSVSGFVLSFFLRRTGGILMLVAAVLLGGFLIYHGDLLIALIHGLPFIICGGTALLIKKDVNGKTV